MLDPLLINFPDRLTYKFVLSSVHEKKAHKRFTHFMKTHFFYSFIGFLFLFNNFGLAGINQKEKIEFLFEEYQAGEIGSGNLLEQAEDIALVLISEKKFDASLVLLNRLHDAGATPDLNFYNSVIRSLSRFNEKHSIVFVLEEMIRNNVRGNKETFLLALRALNNTLEEGYIQSNYSLKYINEMIVYFSEIDIIVALELIKIMQCCTENIEISRLLVSEKISEKNYLILVKKILEIFIGEYNFDWNIYRISKIFSELLSNRLIFDLESYKILMRFFSETRQEKLAQILVDHMVHNNIKGDPEICFLILKIYSNLGHKAIDCSVLYSSFKELNSLVIHYSSFNMRFSRGIFEIIRCYGGVVEVETYNHLIRGYYSIGTAQARQEADILCKQYQRTYRYPN